MSNNTSPGKYPFKKTLYQGMKGRDVEVLQMWLDDLNSYYEFRKNKSLSTTGYFGDETRRFVASFQLFVDLAPADGYYDRRTHEMLQARYYNYITSINNMVSGRGAWNR